MSANGSIRVTGDAKQVRALLAQHGITAKGTPHAGTLTFSAKQATAVIKAIRSTQPRGVATAYTIPTESFRAAYVETYGGGVRKTIAGIRAAARHGRRLAQDDLLPVKQLQDAITSAGGDAADVYQMTELFHGRTGYRLERFRKDHVRPLLEEIAKGNFTLTDVEQFLYATYAPVRNRKIEGRDAGSGMTDKDAADILAGFRKRGLTPKLEQPAARVYAMIRERIELQERAGLITKDTAAAWRADPTYVPLKGLPPGSDPAAEFALRGYKGYSVAGQESRNAKGRDSRASGLLEHAIADVELAVVRAERNRVAQTLVATLAKNPNPELWTVERVKVVASRNPDTGEATDDDSERATILHRHYPNDANPPVFSAKIDGKEFMVRFHGEAGRRIAEGLKNLGAANLSGALRLFRSVNRWLSLTRTAWNPEFVVTNFARDIQTAMTNLSAEQGGEIARATFKGIRPALGAIFRHERSETGNGGAQAWDVHYREFLAAGGKTDFGAARDLDQIMADVHNELGRGNRRNAMRRTYDAFMAANTAVENASRLAAFVAARKAGIGTEHAASIAKNLTVNFNRRGTWGPTINALYMFSNASIQGTARFAQFVAHDPKKAALYWAMPMFSMGLAASFLNTMLGGDDEDGEARWAKVPDWERDRNLVLMWGEHRAKIPLPYVYSLPYTIGVRVGDYVQGLTKSSTTLAAIVSSVIDGINPLGTSQTVTGMLAPTLADPVVEIVENKNFAGRPIMPERNPFEPFPTPDSQRAWPSTDAAYKWVAEAINSATGGSKVRQGASDVSPETIEHWLRFWTGGLGSTIGKATDTAQALFGGELPEARRVPFLGRVYGEIESRQVSIDYYAFRETARIGEAEAELSIEDGLARTASPDERKAWADSIRLGSILRRTERQLRSLRKSKKAARDDEAAKRADEQIRKAQARFNRAYVGQMKAVGEPVR